MNNIGRVLTDEEVAILERALDPCMGWRPIETAPRDDDAGSILVCNAMTQDGFQQVVFWDSASKRAGWHWATSDGPTFHEDAFTHWRPLDPPPKL